jgi:HEAT repeat protein
MSWNDLSEMIYHETGLAYFEGFNPPGITFDPVEELRYEAAINWNEAEQTVEIAFQALGKSVDELVSVRAVEKRFDGNREHTITFTGEEDRSVISVSPAIENIQLTVTTHEDIDLAVEKPFMFWIDQLRNDPDPEEREEAAEALAGFTDNPDLQLALNDLLDVESHPAVYAEILRSLSKLTAGDAGMEQRFLPYLSEDRNREVRMAAIESLANFDGNERVISQLRSIAINSEDPALKRKAIQTLSSITEAERYVQIVNSLVTREPLLDQVPLLLQTLADKGEEEAVVEIASTFTAQQFPYDVRIHALELLLQYDRSPENWNERMMGLFNDQHPHIRMRAAEALSYLTESERESITPTLLEDSYDERVRRAIMLTINR